ncbi:TolC family outer membrane protein [Rhodanobacter sp. Col0626]|uniref:TolC family outer membrane protein n=1 Tax=Rhodanobacter sp. Col0626 TaxID=3415679 RepID=UPI003CED7983
MRVKLLSLMLCLGLVSMPGHGEDLMDAYHQAIANDPVLSTADAARLVVAENVPQARSALLPQLSVGLGLEQIHGGNGSVTNSSGNIVDTGSGGHTRERDLNGTLSQPIIDLSAIASLKAAQASRDSGDQTYQAALQNLYVRVSAAYLNVLIAQDNLDVFKSYEDAYKQEFDQSSTRFKNGLATASDMTQSQAYYLYIKSQRISAQDSFKDAKRALEQITGQPTGTLKKLRDDLPMQAPVPADAKAWVDAAMQSNPTILAGHYAVKADEHRVSAARAGHLPTLNASLQYGKFGSWSSAVPGAAAYGPGVTTIGLTLTVPIFSGGLTQSQVRQAIAQRDQDEGLLETQRRQAARDADNYFNLVIDGIDQVDAARTSVDAARKSLTSMRAGYAIGTQSLTNVVFAIETLANVQSEYTVVRHQFILNKLLLKQAAGSVDVHDLEDINKLLE